MSESAEENTEARGSPSRRTRASRRQRLGIEQAAQAVHQAKNTEVGGILGGPSVVALYPQHDQPSGSDETAGTQTLPPAATAPGGVVAAPTPEAGPPAGPAMTAHPGGSTSAGDPPAAPVAHPAGRQSTSSSLPQPAGSATEFSPDEFRVSGDDVEALSLRYVRGMSDAAGKLSVAVPLRLKEKIERLETFLWRQHRQTLIRDRFFARALQRMTEAEEWRAEARAAQLRREPRVQISPRVSAEVMDRLFDIAKTPPPVPYGALLIVAVEHEFARLGAPAAD